MNHVLTGVLLLLLAGQARALEEAQAGTGLAAIPVVGDFVALSESYQAALEQWEERYREARGMKARRELKAEHPALEFWPKFEGLADEGEGRALLWMAEHLREKGLRVKDARAERARLFGVLAEQYIAAEWFGDVLALLPKERRSLAEGQELAVYRAAIERNSRRDVQAQAMYQLSETLVRSQGERAQAESDRWMEKLAAEYADTPHGEQAAGILFERRHLSVGKIAPDFEAQTIDGHAFKLSDYRGKVVLLDFYGFW